MNSTRTIGDALESATEGWLAAQGLRPLARQVRYRLGELDLVMLHGEVLVFVEVRYRATASHGDGLDSVTTAKQKKLVRAARLFLQGQPRYANTPCRFDVVSVSGASSAPHFDWLRDAFRVDG